MTFGRCCAIAAWLAGIGAAPALRRVPPPLADAWIGTWVLDRPRSGLVGPSIVIARVAQGFLFDFGAVRFTVGDDGRDYPTVAPRTTSLRALGSRAWLRVHKSGGREIDRSRLEIAPDQRRLLIDTVAKDAEGRVRRSHETLRRIGRGTGLAGTWRSGSSGANVTTHFSISSESGGRLRFDYPDERQFYLLRPDGTSAPLLGPGAVAGVTMRLAPRPGGGWCWTEFVAGKAYRQGVDRLLAGGHALEETSWLSLLPDERQRAFYRRARRGDGAGRVPIAIPGARGRQAILRLGGSGYTAREAPSRNRRGHASSG